MNRKFWNESKSSVFIASRIGFFSIFYVKDHCNHLNFDIRWNVSFSVLRIHLVLLPFQFWWLKICFYDLPVGWGKKWKMSLPKIWSQKLKIWQSFNVWSNNLVNIFIKLFLKDFASNTSKEDQCLWTGKITAKMLFCLNVWKAKGFSQSYGCYGSRRLFTLLFWI